MRLLVSIIISAVILLALTMSAQADSWIITKGKVKKVFHDKVEAAKYVALCLQDINLAQKPKPKKKVRGKDYAGL